MRPFWITALALAAAASPLPNGSQDGADAAQVEALRAELDEVKRELEETRALVDDTVTYLQSHAKSSAQMVSVLSASEDAGFTFGINPESRELLLDGWRKQLDAAQKHVPGGKAKAADPQPAQRLPRGARRE